MTSGTYQRSVTAYGDLDLTLNTETEMTELAADIVCTEDALLSWIRFQWVLAGTDETTCYEWFIIKCQSTDATQDLSSATVVEDLQRQSKIFARGFDIQPAITSGSTPHMHKHEWFKVKLVRGEELRLLIRPLLSNTASHVKKASILEWRQVGA